MPLFSRNASIRVTDAYSDKEVDVHSLMLPCRTLWKISQHPSCRGTRLAASLLDSLGESAQSKSRDSFLDPPGQCS